MVRVLNLLNVDYAVDGATARDVVAAQIPAFVSRSRAGARYQLGCLYIGVNDVNGVDCDHVAFSSRNIDLQLWLDRSGKPVPRKIVINYRTEPGSPEYIAVLSDWKFPKQISDNRFSPHLPKDARRIEFLKVKESQP